MIYDFLIKIFQETTNISKVPLEFIKKLLQQIRNRALSLFFINI
jgi:hypothetical protein